MTPLRQQMIDAMQVRGLAVRTQEAYVDALARMARHFGRSPAELDAAQIEAYMLHLARDKHRSFSTINHVASASRFLFRHVLKREDRGLEPPVARSPQRQPELLGRAEITRLLAACKSPAMRTLLQVTYASGLRVSEACALRVRDIDAAADRMCIRVVQGKGSADRYTLLSSSLLAVLREHCRRTQCHRRGAGWLFANPSSGQPWAAETVQRHYGAAKRAAGIRKGGSTHTLRHCCATHLLEAGIDLHTICSLLGHKHIETTRRYLHLTSPQFRPPQGVDALDLLAGLPALGAEPATPAGVQPARRGRSRTPC